VFTARYGLGLYIKQIGFVFKGLIGVAFSGNRNVAKKESEKIKKKTKTTLEIQREWNVKT
jgi:hypothetical protein